MLSEKQKIFFFTGLIALLISIVLHSVVLHRLETSLNATRFSGLFESVYENDLPDSTAVDAEPDLETALPILEARLKWARISRAVFGMIGIAGILAGLALCRKIPPVADEDVWEDDW